MPPKGQHWRLLSTIKELDPAWVRYLGEGAALSRVVHCSPTDSM